MSVVRLTFACPSGPLELMAVPPCPHEGCGWFMPQLYCPDHGNFGMTYLFVKQGPITWVKAVPDIEPLPAEDDPVARCNRCEAPASCGEFGRCVLEQPGAGQRHD